MIDQISVRAAQPDDAQALSLIWLETAELLATLDGRFRLQPDGAARWRTYFLATLDAPDSAIFAAIRRGVPSGYLIGGVVSNAPGFAPDRIGIVRDLSIDSHGHGGATGTKLWEAFSGWLRERQITQVELHIPSQHMPAQAFWRAIGARAWYDHMQIKLRDAPTPNP